MPDVQYPDDPAPNPSTIRIEDLLAGNDAASPAAQPVREGLPRSFRMRADRHYVEMLDDPQAGIAKESPVVSPPPAVAPSRISESQDDETLAAAVRAGNDLAQSLSALRAGTNLLSERGGLASSVAANLIRAEAWRATCLLQISRFLRGELSPSIRPVPARAVVDQVLEAIEPERRLRGIAIERRISVGDRRIATDEQLLVGAMSGLLMAMIAGIETTGAVVTVSAESRSSEVDFTISHGSEVDTDWIRRLAVFTRAAAALGGALTMPSGESTARFCVRFPAMQSASSQ